MEIKCKEGLMNKIVEIDFKSAHLYSSLHRKQVLGSDLCGCFYCSKIFSPNKIEEWIDEGDDEIGQTAMCPFCDIDSVIGSASYVPITPEFLSGMNQLWFGCSTWGAPTTFHL